LGAKSPVYVTIDKEFCGWPAKFGADTAADRGYDPGNRAQRVANPRFDTCDEVMTTFINAGKTTGGGVGVTT